MGQAEKRLKNARAVRRKAAAKLKQLEKGKLTLVNILGDPPDALRSMDIWDVLRRAPHMGRAGAEKVLTTSGVFAHRKMKDLTAEERRSLIQHLPPRAKP